MSLKSLIKAFDNKELPGKEETARYSGLFDNELEAALSLEWQEVFPVEVCYQDIIYDFKEVASQNLKAALRVLKLLMALPIGSIKRLKLEFFAYVSLLFGLCSGQSSHIFRAFYGCSLSRIPSL
jgi:hypothetical protein